MNMRVEREFELLIVKYSKNTLNYRHAASYLMLSVEDESARQVLSYMTKRLIYFELKSLDLHTPLAIPTWHTITLSKE